MKSTKYIFSSLLILMVCLSSAMERKSNDIPEIKIHDTSDSNFEKRKRDIFFKSIIVYKVGLKNKFAERLEHERHPLAGHLENFAPYKQGTGGLLNPLLKYYTTTKDPVNGENYKGVRITIDGHVAADGIAPYEFDKTFLGKYFSETSIYEGKTYIKADYEMSQLEEAVLGYLKERAVDRVISDINETFFDQVAKRPFSNAFISCIKHEWTSKQSDQDSGIRTEKESELIQRHMARSTFWPSKWHSPENMRTGEYMRKNILDGENDPFAAIEMEEFTVSVKIPGTNQECCLQ